MSGYKRITDLPVAGTITGSEAIELVQNGVSVQTTVADITGVNVTACTVRQMKEALVNQGLFYEVEQAVPSDPGNLTTIEWTVGGGLRIDDGLYTLIMTTLGYDTNQMSALIALAQTMQS